MIRLFTRSVCLWLVLGACLAAQTRATRLRGTVQDAANKKAIPGATVSASGDVAQESEITDDNGFFRMQITGVVPGDLIRLRVAKPGYAVYDQQVVATEEIPLIIPIRRLGGSVPAGGKSATGSAPINAVVAPYIAELKAQAVYVRLNALKMLADAAPQNAQAMSAVIAAATLNDDYRVRLQAVYDIESLRPASKQAVTNLMIALNDPEPLVQNAAIFALGAFPHDKDALATLFQRLGTPPSINYRVLESLVFSGVKDPRISKALVYEATMRDEKSIRVLESIPQSPALVSQLSAELVQSLDSPVNFHAQGLLEVLLKGDPQHKALHDLLQSLDSYHQSRLVLAWLEVDHGAGKEIQQRVPAAGLSEELNKARALLPNEMETVFLEIPAFRTGASTECNFGVQLRASMGMLVLHLEPRAEAWKRLASALDSSVHALRPCRTYAAAVSGWLSASDAKPVVALLGQVAICPSVDRLTLEGRAPAKDVLRDTLAAIGDESTVALLQRNDQQRAVACGFKPDGYDWLSREDETNIIKLIQDRTNH